MIDNNVVKASFSDKKYDIPIQTNAILIVNNYCKINEMSNLLQI